LVVDLWISLQTQKTLKSRRDFKPKLIERQRKLKQPSSPKRISRQIQSGLMDLDSLLTEALSDL
jgi:hypothetical protein